MTPEQYESLMTKLDSINSRLDSQDSKINPMYEVFSSVNGFNRVTITIMKGLAMIGAALIGLYALIELFKKLAH